MHAVTSMLSVTSVVAFNAVVSARALCSAYAAKLDDVQVGAAAYAVLSPLRLHLSYVTATILAIIAVVIAYGVVL